MSLHLPPSARREGNAYIGEQVHTLMWRAGRSQRELAAILNVDQGSISNRLRGKTQWPAVELNLVAAWLGVSLAELLPPPSEQPVGYKHLAAVA